MKTALSIAQWWYDNEWVKYASCPPAKVIKIEFKDPLAVELTLDSGKTVGGTGLLAFQMKKEMKTIGNK